MNVYLDNCHLQKVAKNLSLREKFQEKFILILSWNLIHEILKAEDESTRAEKIDFIEKVPHKFLKRSNYLILKEIIKSPDGSFSDHFVDTDIYNTLDTENYLCFRNKTIKAIMQNLGNIENLKIPKISEWAQVNADISKNLGVKYWPEVKKLYQIKFYEMINNNNLIKKDEKAERLKECSNNPKEIPSFSIPFYVQNMRHRDSARTWQESDLWDIYHCNAIPHVDFFLTDRENHNYVCQSLKKLGMIDYQQKLILRLEDIL